MERKEIGRIYFWRFWCTIQRVISSVSSDWCLLRKIIERVLVLMYCLWWLRVDRSMCLCRVLCRVCWKRCLWIGIWWGRIKENRISVGDISSWWVRGIRNCWWYCRVIWMGILSWMTLLMWEYPIWYCFVDYIIVCSHWVIMIRECIIMYIGGLTIYNT